MGQPLFRIGFAIFSFFAASTAVACGGAHAGEGPGSPASAGASGGTTPGTGRSSGSGESSGGGSEKSGPSASGTTTTMQLGDGGDLQGAKLGDKVHTETESKGNSGPKSTGGQSANEPGRSAKDLQAIVTARRDEARACYDKALTAHPGIEGDLDIRWVIDPQGNVTDASVDTTKSQILEPSVGSCIIDVIKKIKFAASAKGYVTHAHYPFNFHPKTVAPKGAGK